RARSSLRRAGPDGGGARGGDRLLLRHAEPAPDHGEPSADERAKRQSAAPARLRARRLCQGLPADRRPLAGPCADGADESRLAPPIADRSRVVSGGRCTAPALLFARRLDLDLDLRLVAEPLVLDADAGGERAQDACVGALAVSAPRRRAHGRNRGFRVKSRRIGSDRSVAALTDETRAI